MYTYIICLLKYLVNINKDDYYITYIIVIANIFIKDVTISVIY